MANSKFKVCSLALSELGISAISSFSDNTPASRVCGEVWDDYSEFLLSVFPWRFTMRKKRLGRSSTDPLNEWQYAYELPSDMIGTQRAAFQSDKVRGVPILSYEIFGHELYANAQEIYIDYQAYVDPINWPSYFLEFAVKALASKIAMPLTRDGSIAQSLKVEAFGMPQDAMKGGLFAIARGIDSRQMPVEPINSFDVIAARFS